MSRGRERFCEATRSFYGGGMGAGEYKGISGGFGSYSQRGGAAGMVRLRLAGGDIDRGKLEFILGCIGRHGIRRVHITTCQSLQLHDLDAEAVCDIVTRAPAHGIDTLGGGGDNPRNVMASPLSGVSPGGCFDVLPFARAAERHLLSLAGSLDLPRKLKVAFSDSPANDVHATFRDLGFLARPDGRFDVHSAGGLGRDPRPGLRMTVADPAEVLLHVQAMTDVFEAHGNRDDRSRARTRFMPESMGEDAYRAAYAAALERARDAGVPLLDIPVAARVPEAVRTVAPRITAQLQEGLHCVSYHPVGGDIAPGLLRGLHGLTAGLPDARLRLAGDQTLHVINCDLPAAEGIASLTGDGAGDAFTSSVSCVGASVCQIGLRDARALLDGIVGMARRRGFPAGTLPQVRISGCASSCAAHQIAAIGLMGTTAHDASGNRIAAYTLTAGGSRLAGHERFGEAIGDIPENDVPAFLEAVGEAVAAAGGDFGSWYADDPSRLAAVAAGFTVG